MFKARALPFARWRCTRRVFSFERKAPMTGTTIVRRSASRRIAPVVNLTLARWVRRERNFGNPTFLPLRLPFFDARQLPKAATRSAIPVA
jgi:hypothetical protein